MSYILDALRRADAERERERQAAPGLHAQPARATPTPDAGDRQVSALHARSLRVGLAVALIAAVAVAVAGWWWAAAPRDRGPATVQPLDRASRQPAAAPPQGHVPEQATAGAPGVGVAAGAAAPAPAGGDGPPADTPRQVPLPAILPDPPRVPTDPKSERAAPIRPQLPSASRPSVTPAPATRVPAASPGPPARLTVLRELPESSRRALPPLAVAGSMYSSEPAARMLVLDGQVVREGQQLQPGLAVETIGPKSAILSWRGQRFELPF